MTKRVLYICPSSKIGGAETFLRQTSIHNTKKQFHNIYLLFEKGPLSNFLIEKGAEIEFLKVKPRLSKPRTHYLCKQQIEELIRRKKVDLVHSTMAYGAIFAARACENMQCPHLWFQHCQANSWMDLLAASLYHQGIITNSQFTLDKQHKIEKYLMNFFKQKNRKELILPLGTELSLKTSTTGTELPPTLKLQKTMRKDKKIISMLCRVHPLKGIHLIIDAFKKLKTMDFSTPYHLYIWGETQESNPYYLQLNKDIKKHNLPITFAGPSDRVREILQASDLLLNSSVKPETFGLTLIEAMSAGTVPMAPREGGPLEIITENVNGLFFTPRDPLSLAQELKKFLSSPSLQENLEKATRQTVIDKFNVTSSIQLLEKFYLNFFSDKV